MNKYGKCPHCNVNKYIEMKSRSYKYRTYNLIRNYIIPHIVKVISLVHRDNFQKR